MSKLRGPNLPLSRGGSRGGPRQKKLEVADGNGAFGYAKKEKDALNSGRGPLAVSGQN